MSDEVYIPQILNSALAAPFTEDTGASNILRNLSSNRNFTNSRGWNFLFTDDSKVIISKGNISKEFDMEGVVINKDGLMDAQG